MASCETNGSNKKGLSSVSEVHFQNAFFIPTVKGTSFKNVTVPVITYLFQFKLTQVVRLGSDKLVKCCRLQQQQQGSKTQIRVLAKLVRYIVYHLLFELTYAVQTWISFNTPLKPDMKIDRLEMVAT